MLIKEETEQLKAAFKLKKRIDREIREGKKREQDKKRKRVYESDHVSDYDEIYRQFGRKKYAMVVPKNIRKRSLSKAVREGKYMDILDIHGEECFKTLLPVLISVDVERESENWKQRLAGWFKYVLPLKLKGVIKRDIFPVPAVLLLSSTILLGGGSYIVRNDEKKEHQTLIEEYLEDIEKYGNMSENANLTPIQAMMKVTDDMWGRIKGYGEPQIDLTEYAGIDVSAEVGVGVCRNMADDCARRLNAINPDYNARVIYVLMKDGEYERSNIPLTFADDISEKQDMDSNESQDECPEDVELNGKVEEPASDDFLAIKIGEKKIVLLTNEQFDNALISIVGNHAVVLLDVPDDDVSLILDPTNAGIGLYYNGRIKMFNSKGGHPLTFTRRLYGELTLGFRSVLVDSPIDFFESIGIYTNKKIKELYDKYGIEAQNRALEEIRAMDKSSYSESLKVDGTYSVDKNNAQLRDTYEVEVDQERD